MQEVLGMRKLAGVILLLLFSSIAVNFNAKSSTSFGNVTLVADKASATLNDYIVFNLTLASVSVYSYSATGSIYINGSLSLEKVYFSYQWVPTYPFDTLKGEYTIDEQAFNGEYTIGNISVYTGSEYVELFDGVNYTSPTILVHDLHPDVTPPVVTFIEAITPSVTGNDQAEFRVHASDTQNLVDYMWGHLIYTDELNDPQTTCYPNLLFQRIDSSDISDVVYRVQFTVDPYMRSADIQIGDLTLADQVGNYGTYDARLDSSIPADSISIYNTTFDNTPPTADTGNMKLSNVNEEKLFVELNVTDDLSGVKTVKVTISNYNTSLAPYFDKNYVILTLTKNASTGAYTGYYLLQPYTIRGFFFVESFLVEDNECNTNFTVLVENNVTPNNTLNIDNIPENQWTSVAVIDADGDGMPMGWENLNTFNDNYYDDRSMDWDGDLLTNYEEYVNGGDPWITDTDGDGLPDFNETVGGTFVNFADSDLDGYSDGVEVLNDTNPLDPSSYPGNPEPVILTTPGTPVNVTATVIGQAVTVSWDPPVDNGGATITEYRIYRTTTSSMGYGMIGTSNSFSYTDTNVDHGSTYYYVVTAVNSVGEGNYSEEVQSVIPATVPATPQNLVASLDTNMSISLAWDPPVDNGGAIITEYRIYKSTINNTEYELISSSTTPNYTDYLISEGQTYYYVVTAVNSVGESAYSNEVSVTIPVQTTTTTTTTSTNPPTTTSPSPSTSTSTDTPLSTITNPAPTTTDQPTSDAETNPSSPSTTGATSFIFSAVVLGIGMSLLLRRKIKK